MCVCVATPWGLQYLSSPTRDWAVKAPSHNHWTTKEFSATSKFKSTYVIQMCSSHHNFIG